MDPKDPDPQHWLKLTKLVLKTSIFVLMSIETLRNIRPFIDNKFVEEKAFLKFDRIRIQSIHNRGLQRDVVCLCWPKAPPIYESKCGGEGVRGLSQWVQLCVCKSRDMEPI